MKLTLPASWNAVTIGQFQRLHAIPAELSELERRCRTLSILTKNPIETLYQVDISDINKAYNALTFLSTEPKTERYPTEITIDKVKYKGTLDITKLSFGQFIDIESLSKSNVVENLHKLFAVYYTNDKTTFDTRAALFQEQVTVDVAYGLAVFFLAKSVALSNLVQTSLNEEIQKKTKELKKMLPKAVRSSIGGDTSSSSMK